MLPDFSLTEIHILGPATLVIGGLFFAVRVKIVREPDPLKRAFKLYELYLGAIGALLAVVLFAMPSASSDDASIANVKSPEGLLTIIQTYNRTLIKTVAALHWFLFIFVVLFLVNTYRFLPNGSDSVIEPALAGNVGRNAL